MGFSWINPRVRQKRSRINGSGLFAIKKIKKGEIVLVQGGKIAHYSEVYKQKKSLTDICFQIDCEHFICPIKINGKPHRDGAFLMNHSCESNCGLSGQVTFIAIRDIEPKEELTYDYAMTDSRINGINYFYEPMTCNCNSKKCRKIITDSDWKKLVLHKKIKNYFSHYIQKLITDL